jgi:RNA polymerase sigma-70 factor (ECF subfamily)
VTGVTLDSVAREASGRIIAALAARFRDLDIAEEAFADACARAVELWPQEGTPYDPAGWLYRIAERRALDALRRRRTRDRFVPDDPPPEPTAEEAMIDDARIIPDERLRLIFICCHPAIAIEARAALTLRLVCGLSTEEIARAFLTAPATLAQRLIRAKRKIADSGVPYEVPGPERWPERLDAVLSTLEVAYAKAHEDASGTSTHAGYASEMLELTASLSNLLPNEQEVLSFAALVRYAEARRGARLDHQGEMVPLSEQNPALWRRDLIDEANNYFERAFALGPPAPRALQAAIHGVWCRRKNLSEPAPWPAVLNLYDLLLVQRDDPVVRVNRTVALAEIAGVQAALDELDALDTKILSEYLPYHALRADLLLRSGRSEEARLAYEAALALNPTAAEQAWLQQRMRKSSSC